jgi:hypothetical protein
MIIDLMSLIDIAPYFPHFPHFYFSTPSLPLHTLFTHQVLHGDINHASAAHDRYYGIWKKHGFTPESFSPLSGAHHRSNYPLRPELAEVTYFLYRATGDDYYRYVGKTMIDALQNYTRVPCGYAAVGSVEAPGLDLEDTMDSFFIAETIKYLFLLFDDSHPIHSMNVIFTTEGHPIPILSLTTSHTNRTKQGDERQYMCSALPHKRGMNEIDVEMLLLTQSQREDSEKVWGWGRVMREVLLYVIVGFGAGIVFICCC